MEKDVIGKIDIWVMRDGKMPSQVEGLDEFQTINVLSSLIVYINKQMSGKDREYWKKYERTEIKQALYNALANIFGTEDSFPMMNALAWSINRINERVARDKHVSIPDIDLAPDVKQVVN